MKAELATPDVDMKEIVTLSVGGKEFTSTRENFCSIKGTKLDAMFSGRHKVTRDVDGKYFLDRDPKYFRYGFFSSYSNNSKWYINPAVMAFLRGGQLPLPSSSEEHKLIAEEFDFYGIVLSEPPKSP